MAELINTIEEEEAEEEQQIDTLELPDISSIEGEWQVSEEPMNADTEGLDGEWKVNPILPEPTNDYGTFAQDSNISPNRIPAQSLEQMLSADRPVRNSSIADVERALSKVKPGQIPQGDLSTIFKDMPKEENARVVRQLRANTLEDLQAQFEGYNIDLDTGLQDSDIRSELAWMDNMAEKAAYLKKKHPDWTVVVGNTRLGDKLMFVKPGESTITTVDEIGLFNKGEAGQMIGTISRPENLLTMLSLPLTGGLGLFGRVGTDVAASGAGAGLGSLRQRGLGVETDTLAEATGRGAVEGLIGGLVELPTSVAKQLFSSGSELSTTQVREMVKTVDSLNKKYKEKLPVPFAFQGNPNSLMGARSAQLMAFTPNMVSKVDTQEQQVKDFIESRLVELANKSDIVQSDLTPLPASVLTDLMKAERDVYTNAITGGGVSKNEGAGVIRKQAERYFTESSEKFSKVYGDLLRLSDEPAVFDISNVVDVAKASVSEATTELKKAVGDSDVVVENVAPSIRNFLQEVSALNTTVGDYKGVSGLKQLQDLRTKANHLALPATLGTPTPGNAFAKKVSRELSKAIENIQTGDPALVDAWKAASKDYAEHASMMELETLMSAARNNNEIGTVIDTLSDPKNYTTITTMKNRLFDGNQEQWDKVSRAIVTPILEQDIKALPDFIKKFKKGNIETYNEAFSPEMRRDLEGLSELVSVQNSTGALELGDTVKSLDDYIFKNLDSLDMDSINYLIKQGGEPVRDIFQTAVWNRMRSIGDAGVKDNAFNTKNLKKYVSKLDSVSNIAGNKTLLDTIFPDTESKELIKTVSDLGTSIGRGVDMQAGLAKGALAEDLLNPSNYLNEAGRSKALSAFLTKLSAGRESALYTSKLMQDIAFRGKGFDKTVDGLRNIGVLSTEIAARELATIESYKALQERLESRKDNLPPELQEALGLITIDTEGKRRVNQPSEEEEGSTAEPTTPIKPLSFLSTDQYQNLSNTGASLVPLFSRNQAVVM